MFNKLEKYIGEITSALKDPGLLIVSGKEEPNIMAVHWGLVGYIWAKPVFVAAVRHARHTYNLINESGVFTVNVPRKDIHNEIVNIFHTSGKDVDKFTAFHLHPVKAKSVDTYVVGDCGVHLECRVLYHSPVDGAFLDDGVKEHAYEGHEDYHTLFYGEILDIYES